MRPGRQIRSFLIDGILNVNITPESGPNIFREVTKFLESAADEDLAAPDTFLGITLRFKEPQKKGRP